MFGIRVKGDETPVPGFHCGARGDSGVYALWHLHHEGHGESRMRGGVNIPTISKLTTSTILLPEGLVKFAPY